MNIFSQAAKRTAQYSTGETFSPPAIAPVIAYPLPQRIGALNKFAPLFDATSMALMMTRNIPAANNNLNFALSSAAFGRVYVGGGLAVRKPVDKL